MSAYFARNLKLASTHLAPQQKDAIKNIVDEAANFYIFVLDLGPVGKDALRYMGDFPYIMLSFACLFVTQAVEIFGLSIPGLDEHLETAGEVGQLMKELAVNSNQNPGLYGRSIITRINRVCDAKDEASKAGKIAPLFEPYQEEWFMIDPLWDLARIFPDGVLPA